MMKIVVFLFLLTVNLFAGWTTDLETGFVSSGYNNVRIPGDVGTKFALKLDDSNFIRLRVEKQLDEKQSIGFLYAPLVLTGSDVLDKNVKFKDKTFLRGTKINTRYQFNSYRITYKRKFYDKENLKMHWGITGKIREAAIKIESNNQVAEKTDLGFVPLIKFDLDKKISDKLNFIVDADMLAASQGRAEDVLAAMQYSVKPNAKLKFGYRMLEGGADNDKVYTFALINYWVVGLTITF